MVRSEGQIWAHPPVQVVLVLVSVGTWYRVRPELFTRTVPIPAMDRVPMRVLLPVEAAGEDGVWLEGACAGALAPCEPPPPAPHADSKIAMIYALEEEIAATEEMREQVFNRLHDRVTEEAAA